MSYTQTLLHRRDKQFHREVSACVTTLSYSDIGYLTITWPDNEEQHEEIMGTITHLEAPDKIYSSGNKGFAVRYIDTEHKCFVELLNCRPIYTEHNGTINFVTTEKYLRRLSISPDDLNIAETMFSKVQDIMKSRQYRHIVFVFGAGASINVLPGGADLLREMLKTNRQVKIESFIEDVFMAKINDDLPYPSFNRVFNIIDLALEREEGFSARYSLEALREMKRCMITELRKYLIDNNKTHEHNNYEELAKHLKEFYDNGGNISFITLNYDLFLDAALEKVFGKEFINYVIPYEMWNVGKQSDGIENGQIKRQINVIKLHGSLNWMICPTCFKTFRFTEDDLPKSLSARHCLSDHTELQEFLFPPTREKIEVHSHWIRLQHEADQLLRDADKVVFIGFSLSDDDAHFRFKLKKHLYRSENPVYIQVVGKPQDIFDISTNDLLKHYWQFFGPIDYRPSGFENFAKNPF